MSYLTVCMWLSILISKIAGEPKGMGLGSIKKDVAAFFECRPCFDVWLEHHRLMREETLENRHMVDLCERSVR